MYLVQPSLLVADAIVPNDALRAYAQVLCEDFAERIGVQAPRVIVADEQLNHITFDNVLLCQSPIKQWARWMRDGTLALTSFAFNPLQLQFTIGHTLAHLIAGALEWECDLAALEWMNDPAVPLVEPTMGTIAQTSMWRKRVSQSELGARVLAIGDALNSGIWQAPLFQA